MSHYRNQEVDFIQRTKAIIEQYDSFEIAEKEKFEVTLFINCLVGLLILPKEVWFNKLPTTHISKKEWGIKKEHVSFISDGEDKSVQQVARHLRNSLAHYRFKVFGNAKSKITKIKFMDFAQNGEKTFEATFPIIDLKNFISIFSDTILAEMAKEKPKK